MNQRFLVSFSFSGENREYFKSLATLLKDDLPEDRIFFDEWFEHEILGPDMDVVLGSIFAEQSLLIVSDVSQTYADKPWTKIEWNAVRAAYMDSNGASPEGHRARFITVKFDDGRVPGIWPHTGHIDGKKSLPKETVTLLKKRLKLLGWPGTPTSLELEPTHSGSPGDTGAAIATETALAEMDITIEAPFDLFSSEDAVKFIQAISGLTEDSRRRVILVRKRRGSTILTIRMHPADAERVYWKLGQGGMALS